MTDHTQNPNGVFIAGPHVGGHNHIAAQPHRRPGARGHHGHCGADAARTPEKKS